MHRVCKLKLQRQSCLKLFCSESRMLSKLVRIFRNFLPFVLCSTIRAYTDRFFSPYRHNRFPCCALKDPRFRYRSPTNLVLFRSHFPGSPSVDLVLASQPPLSTCTNYTLPLRLVYLVSATKSRRFCRRNDKNYLVSFMVYCEELCRRNRGRAVCDEVIEND